jgi:hypothetical protein
MATYDVYVQGNKVETITEITPGVAINQLFAQIYEKIQAGEIVIDPSQPIGIDVDLVD